MLKPWSISTTVRNPNRIRDFLIALTPLSGEAWNTESQARYQKLLIKNRLYGYGNQQFYNGLPSDIVALINDVDAEIDDQTVDTIIKIKNYTDFPMRGRQSMNPLIKFGLISNYDGSIRITSLGQKLIDSEKDFGDVFLRVFLKWQIPNPANDDFTDDGAYNIVPFVAMLKLIDAVNSLEKARGNKQKGLEKREFALFVPSLVSHTDISSYAKRIIQLRDLQKGKTATEKKAIRDEYRQKFAADFLQTSEQDKIHKFLKNLRDYGDNAVRYFRLTKFIRIRGGGYYIDVEPSRIVEIDALLDGQYDRAREFSDSKEYIEYMSDFNLPELPWHTKQKLTEIANEIVVDVERLRSQLGQPIEDRRNLQPLSELELAKYIEDLRSLRQALQEKDNHVKSQPIEAINTYIDNLNGIFSLENRALMLEYYTTLGLHALNDAEDIKPNYPVGDDNEPTSTAPGGKADIECRYNSFNMICEVTMLKGRDQWFNEGQPVMRHLRDFENTNANAFCLFIAPSIHVDTAETFWIANKVGYRGAIQRIAPVTITQYVEVLKALRSVRQSGGRFTHVMLLGLMRAIIDSIESHGNSDEWTSNIGSVINDWKATLTV